MCCCNAGDEGGSLQHITANPTLLHQDLGAKQDAQDRAIADEARRPSSFYVPQASVVTTAPEKPKEGEERWPQEDLGKTAVDPPPPQLAVEAPPEPKDHMPPIQPEGTKKDEVVIPVLVYAIVSFPALPLFLFISLVFFLTPCPSVRLSLSLSRSILRHLSFQVPCSPDDTSRCVYMFTYTCMVGISCCLSISDCLPLSVSLASRAVFLYLIASLSLYLCLSLHIFYIHTSLLSLSSLSLFSPSV